MDKIPFICDNFEHIGYISKDKIKAKIEELLEDTNLEINEEWDSEDVRIAKFEGRAVLDAYKELLKEE